MKDKDDEKIKMVQECVSKYNIQELPDGSVKIIINSPKRFMDLWLIKLSQLTTTLQEIQDFEPK